MSVILSPRAGREFAGATGWYRSSGGRRLADRFARAVDAAVVSVAADPAALPPAEDSDTMRRCRVRGFPYDLLFRVRVRDVLVLSVRHHHRDPADRPY